MTEMTRIERELSAWLSETAMPRMPDYADEILEETTRIRQRPRWTFVRRWLPIPEVAWASPVGRRTALTAATLLLVLGLILAAIVAIAGSRRTLPPPFGLAGNGLVSAEVGGDIVVVDPQTMVSRTIVAHDAIDHDAHWALDGTRLAFLRETGGNRLSVVVADAAGQVLAISESFAYIDSDSVAWSPDGRLIAIGAARGQRGAIHLIDAATGAARQLAVPYDGYEVYWRPPDRRELLFKVGDAQGGLGIVSIEDERFVRVPTGDSDPFSLRPLGWTAEGRGVLFQDDAADPIRTTVVDVETGALTRLDVAYGHVSNDGTRVAGIDGSGRFCVVSIAGGVCRLIERAAAVSGTHGASVRWSPDDRWIAISTSPVWIVDPTNAVAPRALVGGGPGSWQRIAP